MKPTRKTLPLVHGKRILEIYGKFKLDYLPKIISNCIDNDKMVLDFEWIEGSVILLDNIEKAFYELGRFHLVNKIEDRDIGFTTICHGDFHRNNIIDTGSEIKFVDITYLHENWNYSDLDYIDFYGWFDKEKYPWMIDADNCLEQYHKGIGVEISKQDEYELKKIITINSFQKFIANGRNNRIDTSYEESLLKKILN